MTPKNVCITLKYTRCFFQLDNAFQNHLLFANESYEFNPQSVHIYFFNIMETTFSLKLSIKSTYICFNFDQNIETFEINVILSNINKL